MAYRLSVDQDQSNGPCDPHRDLCCLAASDEGFVLLLWPWMVCRKLTVKGGLRARFRGRLMLVMCEALINYYERFMLNLLEK